VPNPTGDRPVRELRVVLVGMMGSGKSAVGVLTAELLGAGFADSDEEIERSTGLSVQEIFDTRGEAWFRNAESDALKALLSPPRPGPIVVAAGGGAVLRPGNRDLMRREAIVVWLRARTSELTQRIGDVASRPLLTGPKDVADPVDLQDRLESLLNERAELYETVAHFVVDTDGLGPQSVAEAVASLVVADTLEAPNDRSQPT
jgi:shikimate kinase